MLHGASSQCHRQHALDAAGAVYVAGDVHVSGGTLQVKNASTGFGPGGRSLTACTAGARAFRELSNLCDTGRLRHCLDRMRAPLSVLAVFICTFRKIKSQSYLPQVPWLLVLPSTSQAARLRSFAPRPDTPQAGSRNHGQLVNSMFGFRTSGCLGITWTPKVCKTMGKSRFKSPK